MAAIYLKTEHRGLAQSSAQARSASRFTAAVSRGLRESAIIALGIVTRPFHLLVIEIAVGILTLQAIVINRLAGIDYPLWALRDAPR